MNAGVDEMAEAAESGIVRRRISYGFEYGERSRKLVLVSSDFELGVFQISY